MIRSIYKQNNQITVQPRLPLPDEPTTLSFGWR